jgi:hypothetical protein
MTSNFDELPDAGQLNHELAIKGMGQLRYATPDSALKAARSSPYFWWWSYLRISKDYWWTVQCAGDVTDQRLKSMYEDFGDVYGVSFEDWWFDRGVNLFKEQVATPKVRQLNPLDISLSQPSSKFLLLEIPLNLTQRTIIAQIRKKLEGIENRTVQRQNISKRPLAKLTGIRSNSLKMPFEVWKLFYQSRDDREVPRLGRQLGTKSLYQIGKELALVAKCMPVAGELKSKSDKKVNGMKVATSRMLKRANNLILNASVGEFPVVTSPKQPIVWNAKEKLRLDKAVKDGYWQPIFADYESLV